MNSADVYRIFQQTGQEKKRLKAALQGFFEEDLQSVGHEEINKKEINYKEINKKEIYKEEYRKYLKRRVRAAVEILLEKQDGNKILRLIEEGLLMPSDLDSLLMQPKQDPGAFLRLLHIREAWRRTSIQEQRSVEDSSREAFLRQTSPGGNRGKSFSEMISLSFGERNVKQNIMKIVRSQIYTLFPFLDGAIASLPLVKEETAASLSENGSVSGIRTDGVKIYYSPGWAFQKWSEDPCILRRGYLHILLHCLYFHVWDAGKEEDSLCDARVEEIIENECGRNPSLREWLGTGYGQNQPEKTSFDDHSAWPRQSGREQDLSLRHHWEILKTGTGEGSGGAAGHLGIGASPGTDFLEAGLLEKSTNDYRTFLQPFAVPKEEIELDRESFDYIYYSLGLLNYGNMPLIEPLEYREGYKLEELVIAVDTSGSCSLSMVRGFLEETWAILDEKENFFHRMNVWVIQCDCVIQNAAHIRNREDWMAYIRDLRIEGRAGTDFRPVFRYVEDLKKQGKLTRLKGLIYFTDGDGIYPEEAPDYETAFVFLEEKRESVRMPSWANMLRVYPRGRNQ